jgi:hypothetical protein
MARAETPGIVSGGTRSILPRLVQVAETRSNNGIRMAAWLQGSENLKPTRVVLATGLRVHYVVLAKRLEMYYWNLLYNRGVLPTT